MSADIIELFPQREVLLADVLDLRPSLRRKELERRVELRRRAEEDFAQDLLRELRVWRDG